MPVADVQKRKTTCCVENVSRAIVFKGGGSDVRLVGNCADNIEFGTISAVHWKGRSAESEVRKDKKVREAATVNEAQ